MKTYVDVLERATSQGRVVVTHDVAFGRAAIRTSTSFVGIIYLRPGPPSSDAASQYNSFNIRQIRLVAR